MAEYKTNLMNTHLPIVTALQQQTQNTFEKYVATISSEIRFVYIQSS